MCILTSIINDCRRFDDTLTLDFATRVKSRFQAVSANNKTLKVLISRGYILQDGDILSSDSSFRVIIKAAKEQLSVASSDDPLLLARASYHLGNRHTAIQINIGNIYYKTDNVLDAMLKKLGLQISYKKVIFNPELGAYGQFAISNHAH